ncbi:MAG: RluA family pseudouridine synthase [Chitinophagaceae bacterium]
MRFAARVAIFAQTMDMARGTEILDDTDTETEQEEMYERMSLVVDKGQDPLRIDKFLVARMEHATRNKIQKAIDNGRVLVNQKPVMASYKIRPLDQITVYSDREAMGEHIVPEKMDLNITFEDEEIIILNKRPGLVVHPGCGNYTGTLINGVAFHLLEENATVSEETLPRFGLVHRIDKNTSGLMVLAKTPRAISSLAKQFFDHTVVRRYHAIIWGSPEADEGTIIAHIGRHQKNRKLFAAYPEGDHGKEAITHYKVLERFGYVSLVECRLETGRTHQIRVHMQYIGHPIFSDDTYGGDRIVKGTVYTKYKQFVENCFELCPRQALHAKIIGFLHPLTRKETIFTSELPEDMSSVLAKWRDYTTSKW